MVRQARNYLVGALSGVTLIGIAIAAFVVIVSAQVFHEWPIADTGAAQKSNVAPAQAVTSPARTTTGATAAAGTDPVLRANRAKTAAGTKSNARGDRNRGGDPSTAERTGPATVVEAAPGPSSGGETSSSGGDEGGSRPSKPAPSAGESPSGSTGTTSGGTTNSGSPSGSTGGGNPAPGNPSPTAPTGGKTVETPVTATAPTSVAGAVNETVHGVDEAALGGTLEKTGVTEVTEGVVNGVAGPETVVGKTVEGVTEVVGGLLGGNRSSGE